MIMGSSGVASDCAVFLEASGARQIAMDAAQQYGTPIKLGLNSETDLARDSLQTIKKRPVPYIDMKALPVERQPDARKLEKAGIREEVDVLIYIPILYFIERGIIDDAHLGDSFARIDTTRSTVILDGTEFKIADKGLAVRIGQYPLHVTFGLRRG
jgi:hypothetical protein